MLLIGCSREPIEGTVYVIKGDGSIKRAAAIQVHVLPFENIVELENALNSRITTQDRKSLDEFTSLMCKNFKVNALQQRSLLEQFSPSCGAEKLSVEKLPLGIQKEKLQNEKQRIDNLVAMLSLELKQSTESLINTLVDCSSSLNFPGVTIENNSSYRIKSGPLKAYVGDYAVSDCKNNMADLKPGMKMTFNLGNCYYENDKQTVLDNQLAEVCTDNGDDWNGKYPRPDRVGPRENEDWVFLDPSKNDKLVDFVKIAEQNIGQGNLKSLELNLDIALQAQEKLSACTLLLNNTIEIDSLDCPVSGSTRSTINSFRQKASNFGVPTEPPPYSYNESLETFAQRTSIMQTKTDVSSNFFLDDLPNENILIYARYSDSFNELEWLVPVPNSIEKIELNNTNIYQN